MTEEVEAKKNKALIYNERISKKIKQVFSEIFQEISKEPEPDFHLINVAAMAAFTSMAAVLAVDELFSEENFMEVVRATYKDSYAAAPKFG